MRKRYVFGTSILLVLVSFVLSSLDAQQEKGGKKGKKKKTQATSQRPSEEEVMQQWMAYMTPGKEHERLAELEGTWNFTMKIWMSPEAAPIQSTGTSEREMILAGRYLQDKTTSSFQNQPFEGRGLTGYDNAKKKYTSLWIDSMGTGFMIGEGEYDSKKEVWEFVYTSTDPMTGRDKKHRSVERLADENALTVEMYETAPDGKEYKMMEITYTRADG